MEQHELSLRIEFQELYQVFGKHVSNWSVGKTHMGEYACQAMIGEQIQRTVDE